MISTQIDLLRLGKARAISAAGGVCALALKMGIAYQAIQNWKKIPDKHLIAVETVTGVPREELRPDLYRKCA